jgi:Tol biopolymer transport system component
MLLGPVVGLVGIAGPAQAAFPGANGRIVFDTSFGHRPQIFTIRPDGTGLRQLTHVAKGHVAGSPEFSPDGTRIVFTIDGQIWVMNADGSAQRQLTSQAGFQNQQPSWSPDGRKIVFSHCPVPFGLTVCDLDVMNADGSGMRKLLGGNWANQVPEYSPNGHKIAFASNRGGYISAVWVMNANGGGVKRLTDPNLEAGNPDWSPDGTHIVFGTNCCRPRSQIWVMNADGSSPHPLTHMPPRGDAPAASYSPDGHQIVLLTNLNQLVHPTLCCWDLYVMNADGSHLRLITTQDAGVFSPDWSPTAMSATPGRRPVRG